MTHICVSKLPIIASDNGLSPGRRQAIIGNNSGILSIGLLRTNFSEILIKILTFSFKKMRLKMSFAKWRLLRLGLNELRQNCHNSMADALELPQYSAKPSIHYWRQSTLTCLPMKVTLRIWILLPECLSLDSWRCLCVQGKVPVLQRCLAQTLDRW